MNNNFKFISRYLVIELWLGAQITALIYYFISAPPRIARAVDLHQIAVYVSLFTRDFSARVRRESTMPLLESFQTRLSPLMIVCSAVARLAHSRLLLYPRPDCPILSTRRLHGKSTSGYTIKHMSVGPVEGQTYRGLKSGSYPRCLSTRGKRFCHSNSILTRSKRRCPFLR